MCCLAVIFIINLLTILLFITMYNVVAKFHSPMIFKNDILLATIIMGLRIYTFYSSIFRSEQGTFSYKLFSMYKICKSGFNISEKKRIINKFRFYTRKNLATCYYFLEDIEKDEYRIMSRLHFHVAKIWPQSVADFLLLKISICSSFLSIDFFCNFQ